jgi:hypothetical protein
MLTKCSLRLLTKFTKASPKGAAWMPTRRGWPSPPNASFAFLLMLALHSLLTSDKICLYPVGLLEQQMKDGL